MASVAEPAPATKKEITMNGINNPDSIVEQIRKEVMKPSESHQPSDASAWTYDANLPQNGADPTMKGLTFPKNNLALK